jgi:pyruvate formate lyase activating enzyme
MYKLTQLPQTPLQTLIKAREIAERAGMKYVYIGNIPAAGMENTKCPKCSKIVVERMGFSILNMNLKSGCCAYCGTKVNGIWQ